MRGRDFGLIDLIISGMQRNVVICSKILMQIIASIQQRGIKIIKGRFLGRLCLIFTQLSRQSKKIWENSSAKSVAAGHGIFVCIVCIVCFEIAN